MASLTRKVFPNIMAYLPLKEIIVITGMRRVGKSTLLSMIYDSIESGNKVMLDIENPLDRIIFEEKDYNNILQNFEKLSIEKGKKIYILLDEIQAYPDIVRPIKYLYDHYDIKFIVTGSSSFYLKNLFPESLAGRKIEVELFPLDFDEFIYFKGATKELVIKATLFSVDKSELNYHKRIKLYDEYLQYGGFPQVVLASTNELKKIYLRDIFKSYFQTDLLQLTNIKNISQLRDLIILLAVRTGNKIDVTRIASELGITRETVYNYLSFLSGSYFFHFISRYGKNADKEISSTQKVYICDNGIANEISKLTEGQLLESAVYLNLRKYGNVKYYHDKSQREIDFVLPDQNFAIEVKRNAISIDFLKLNRFAGSLNIENKQVISYNYSNEEGIFPACLL